MKQRPGTGPAVVLKNLLDEAGVADHHPTPDLITEAGGALRPTVERPHPREESLADHRMEDVWKDNLQEFQRSAKQAAAVLLNPKISF